MSAPMIAPRPMRVVVAPGSKAESYRGADSAGSPPGPIPAAQDEAIAPGSSPQPAPDLSDSGGHIIIDLVFTNFFVGGADAWDPADIAKFRRKSSILDPTEGEPRSRRHEPDRCRCKLPRLVLGVVDRPNLPGSRRHDES